jgi:hypothetical protein
MANFKITGLGAATAAADAVRFSQLQGSADKLLTVTGTDTYVATASPALTAYAAGNLFSLVVPNTNTGASTINIDGLGAKAITRTGSTALVAGDMIATEVVIVVYDGTRFQLINANSFTNLLVSGTLTYGGVTLTNAVTGTGKMVLDTSPAIATPTITNPTVTNYVESPVAIGNSGTTQTLSLTSGTFQTVTLTGNCTFTMPTATAGKSFILILVQDGTGGRTATFTSVKWPSGTAPTITTTATTGRDIITFFADGTNWYGAAVQNFS